MLQGLCSGILRKIANFDPPVKADASADEQEYWHTSFVDNLNIMAKSEVF